MRDTNKTTHILINSLLLDLKAVLKRLTTIQKIKGFNLHKSMYRIVDIMFVKYASIVVNSLYNKIIMMQLK